MSAYQFELDMYSDNANADIIKFIAPQSRVLEFGPAYGRMTKYLKEELRCRIDIVEMDEPSGRIAAQYAERACLGRERGNIERLEWAREFAGTQYDAIVFTDVLEHLRNPQQVLQSCLELLKDEGAILCSVPNIAHASVILSLLNGQFRYTSTGLLDRTHVHFFTEQSFKELAEKSGLYVEYEHAIRVPVGANEIPETYETIGRDAANALRERANNEAYQFIFKLKKQEPDHVTMITGPMELGKVWCYIKDAEDAQFSEQKRIYKNINSKTVDVLFSLEEFSSPKAARIVLLDCNAVVRLEAIAAVTDDGEMELTEYDITGVRLGHRVLCFFAEQSELYVWLPPNTTGIHLRYEILLYHSDVLTMVGKEIYPTFETAVSEKNLLGQEKEKLLCELKKYRNEQQELLAEREASRKKQESEKQELQAQMEILQQRRERDREEIAAWKNQWEAHTQEQGEAEGVLEQSREELQRLREQIEEKNREIGELGERVRLSGEQVLAYRNSLSWKISAPVRLLGNAAQFGAKPFVLLKNACIYFRKYGLRATVDLTLHYPQVKAAERKRNTEIAAELAQDACWEELESWLEKTPHDFIDIFPVPMGWNTPLFQRFQHISLQAGRIGGVAIYGAHPAVDKEVNTYRFFSPTLCLVNLEETQVSRKLWALLDSRKELRIVRLQSIDLATRIETVEEWLRKGYEVVYEYIDEITPQITGSIPPFVRERHEYLLKNAEITVVATSDKLFRQATKYRTENMLMLSNGVDYAHWHLDRGALSCPEDMQPAVSSGKLIVGYHGALAQWVDYELLRKIAQDGRFALVLIGYEHDGNLKKSGVLGEENVYYLGPKTYQELGRYAAFYDIAILPFVVNEITLSVSPVKIFEYMAAGKPVVSYGLPECRKYKSCLCADNQEQFLQAIDKAVSLRGDAEYLRQLDQDAQDNTWTVITQKMVDFVKKKHQEKKQRSEAVRIPLNEALSAREKEQYIEQIVQFPRKQKGQEYVALTKRPYERQNGDSKVIAYYLTQFHPDAHNEAWWGRGETEWNNVTRAVPQYTGHYQPRLPGELGFYDLRIMENMQRQIELAKQYGIYGFSFYYYWFNGGRLLEKPLEMFLAHPELTMPFSLCWANENWTKRYDGTNMDILMEQPRSVQSYQNVIEDMLRFLPDARYIEVQGKKLLTIYRPSLMPSPERVLAHWRQRCREQGIELYLIAVKENMVETDWLEKGFDAVSEFHPGTLYVNCKNITDTVKNIRADFKGEVFSYPDLVQRQKYFKYNTAKLYRAAMPMWDNTARRDHKGMIFEGATPSLYKQWLKDIMREQKERQDLEEPMIFINAWNEWGEGAYLEPDRRYGYAYLEATKEAVEEMREENTNRISQK